MKRTASPTDPAQNIFERHARLTVLAVALVSIVATNFVFAGVYHALCSAPAPRTSARLRIPSPILDHAFAPLVDDLDALHGGGVVSPSTQPGPAL